MRFALSAMIVLASLLAGSVAAPAEDASSAQPLIKERIDEGRTVPLIGNTRPEVRRQGGWQTVPDSMRLGHIHLLLKPPPTREAAADAAVAALTERGSATYHRWVSAEEFGRRFGAADADIAAVTGWLKGKGFTVNRVYPNRLVIDFSGTAGQVVRAFHTAIGRAAVGGVEHIANLSDPQVPAALAPAVAGIVALHDFHPHNARRPRATVSASCGYACNVVGPGDLATIYNLNPIFSAGFVGQGQTIAVVEATDLYDNNDWYNFRNAFGLNRYATGNLQIAHPGCYDPGVDSGQDVEAALDTEWASAAAPGATIELASCANDGVSDGVFLAIENLVNSGNPPPMISVSYALCEVDNGAGANAAFNRLYQQAAAEGISVFVAAGDTGASNCAPGPGPTYSGIGVNGWGDSQYNVSVGGTDFSDTYSRTNSRYWNSDTGAPWSTARSYIPEIPWNDNCASTLISYYYTRSIVTYGANGFCNSQTGQSFQTLVAGGGGSSHCYSGSPSVSDTVSGSCRGYPKPSWQQGIKGMAADGVRDVPDVAMFAADGIWGHAYATCYSDPNGGGGSCSGNPEYWSGNGGGTSYGAPVMAGIQALINQHAGGPQGNPNPVYYGLANRQNGSAGDPNCSANLGASIESDCIFHDIVSGDTDVYCNSYANCYWPSGNVGVLSVLSTEYRPAFHATTGYDRATGLGSVNAYNLLINWY